jgi:hypothetical protein
MATRGKVRAINPQNGFVAIETEGNGFSIIELMGDDDIELGDEMWWQNDLAMGAQNYKNLTKGKIMQVFVQNHAVQPESVLEHLS